MVLGDDLTADGPPSRPRIGQVQRRFQLEGGADVSANYTVRDTVRNDMDRESCRSCNPQGHSAVPPPLATAPAGQWGTCPAGCRCTTQCLPSTPLLKVSGTRRDSLTFARPLFFFCVHYSCLQDTFPLHMRCAA